MEVKQRPFLIRAFNFFGVGSSLDSKRLMRAAQQKTGLDDFGNDPLIEPLDKLLSSINAEAALHPFGQFITRQRLINVLANRLRVVALLKKHPEILEIQIEQPIIITGLQRTGTTRLHRLLSNHPNVRSLRSWEALNPVPFEGDHQNKKRIQFAKTAETALKYMSPAFFAIHPVEHEAPEEDILLNDMSFISTVPEATMHVPAYAAWVETESHLFPYAYLKKLLQILSWQHPKERWVLKTPQYLEFLEEAHQVFPDAKYIHTYRDPLKVIPSFCSMVFQSRRIFSDKVDAQELSKHWLRKNSYMMNDALKFWKEQAAKNVLHVSYYDMMNDFHGEMKKIYSFVGLPYSQEIEDSLTQHNAINKQNKYGVHQYQVQDFGLSHQEIDDHFSLYRQTFSIPYE